jgi:hypothetical protein
MTTEQVAIINNPAAEATGNYKLNEKPWNIGFKYHKYCLILNRRIVTVPKNSLKKTL